MEATEGDLTLDKEAAPDTDCISPVGLGTSERVKETEGVLPPNELEANEDMLPSGERDANADKDTVAEVVEEREKEGEALGSWLAEGWVEVD